MFMGAENAKTDKIQDFLEVQFGRRIHASGH